MHSPYFFLLPQSYTDLEITFRKAMLMRALNNIHEKQCSCILVSLKIEFMFIKKKVLAQK